MSSRHDADIPTRVAQAARDGEPGVVVVPLGSEAPIGGLRLLRIFIPFALGYFLSYFFRTINAIIAPELTTEFTLSAGSVGLLTSSYLFMFGLMQIPIGLLVDRFGPRRVQSGLLLVAALGAFGFATGHSFIELTLARGLIGAGVAGCLMIGFSAFIVWLPARWVPAASGLLMAFGGLGAFAAGAPTESFIADGGAWRDLFLGLTVATLIVAAIVFVTVPERKSDGKDNWRELLSGLRRIYSDAVFWRVAPLSITSLGAAFALWGLWAGPWLMQVAHRDSHAVGVHLSVMAIALIIGSAACGPVVALAARVGLTMAETVAVLAFLFMLALAGLVFQLTDWSLLLWAIVGFLTNPISISYFVVTQRFETTMAARASTGINALVLVGSFLFQWLIGRIISLWEPIAPGVYPAEAFRVSFGAVLVCVMLAWLWNLRWIALQRRKH